MFEQRKWLAPLVGVSLVALAIGAVTINRAYSPPIRLDADLSSRTLTVIENGKPIKTYGIAVGRPSYPTPTGTFTTGDIDWNPAWVPPDDDWARNKKPQAP